MILSGIGHPRLEGAVLPKPTGADEALQLTDTHRKNAGSDNLLRPESLIYLIGRSEDKTDRCPLKPLLALSSGFGSVVFVLFLDFLLF